MTNLVDKRYYSDVYGGIEISDNAEFEKLSSRAEGVIDAFVQSEVLNWKYNQYVALKENKNESIKKAICQEIEVLYQSNGMQAVTGGADAGLMEVFGGVPLAKTAKNGIIQVLAENNIWYKGA